MQCYCDMSAMRRDMQGILYAKDVGRHAFVLFRKDNLTAKDSAHGYTAAAC